MSFGMSIIMCAVVTAVGTGINAGYIERFFRAWIFAFPVAVLAAFTMALITRKLVDKITS
jgi:phosphate/sulfate permease